MLLMSATLQMHGQMHSLIRDRGLYHRQRVVRSGDLQLTIFPGIGTHTRRKFKAVLALQIPGKLISYTPTYQSR